jgi:hypothetical protein
MRVLAYVTSRRPLAVLTGPVLALPVLAVAALPLVTPAQGADIVYEQTYQETYRQSYEQPYEVYRHSHPAPVYTAPPDYRPPRRYMVERYVEPPSPYVAPRPYVYQRYQYVTPPYGVPYDPYPRRYVEVERPPAPVVVPRRAVRVYPSVGPDDVYVNQHPSRVWREAPDPHW